MTTQSRMQQIDTLANYPMGTKPDSFRLIKKTFKSGEPMKTKIICFIAFVSYTFYNPQIEMFARFKTKSSFHKTKRII